MIFTKEPIWLLFLVLPLFLSESVYAFPKYGRSESAAFTAQWLEILHADVHGDSFKTRVVSEGFLITSDSTVFDAGEELVASLEHFKAGMGVCSRPSRYLFLAGEFGLPIEALERCEFLDDLSFSDLEGSDVTVVYASGYLGNPASYYGHMFLTVTPPSSSNKLLDKAINYGAINASGDNPVSYIAKGLFGGYEGAFSLSSYYVFDNQYRTIENRDLWEYRLHLDDKAKLQLLTHIAELSKHKFNYYFMGRNCVSAFAEIINVVAKRNFDAANTALVYPHAWLKYLVSDSSIPVSSQLVPSRATEFRSLYKRLSTTQLTAINKYDVTEGPVLSVQQDSDEVVVLDTLLLYSQAFKDDETFREDALREVTAKRLDIDLVSESYEFQREAKLEPHIGRNPAKLSWGLGSTDDDVVRLFSLRPAFYDEADGASLGFGGNALVMIDNLFSQDDQGEVRLETLDLLAINEINPKASGFRNDGSLGWTGHISYERKGSAFCRSLCAGLESKLGLLTNISPNDSGSLALGGAFYLSQQSGAHFRASVFASGIINISENIAVIGKVSAFDRSTSHRPNTINQLGVSAWITENLRFSLEYRKHRRESVSVNVDHYF
ncbi:DUF4105 domain-containing protein [Candidatus Paraluminiphilus aquimaris]|uniref:DUF4105 domain-containing protein n=1 Tax=Candidatus Paraluminiphilus aquimaris TaxID=2518994 RepID=A0ABY6Q4I6_9GAMM|nr:DUF4105 domain-containing protein [Candidatus Paraluminiphilus aquimaris]UZP74192.1 DUF4105 domain-containing protein [Candidatus Paraluminiphilus aquimaris]